MQIPNRGSRSRRLPGARLASLLMLSMSMLGWAVAASAMPIVIAGTSFENETPGGAHTDANTDGSSLPLGTVVALSNDDGGLVNSTSSSVLAGDLGFTAFWTNTRNAFGLMGDRAGVQAPTASFPTYDTGNQGYRFADPDGAYSLRFDAVDLSLAVGAEVSLALFVLSSNFESDDLIQVVVETDVGMITVLDTSGSDIDDLGIEGSWMTFSAMIPDAATTATLVVTSDTNFGGEDVYLDSVVFTAVPEPGTAALALLGLAALGARSRRSS